MAGKTIDVGIKSVEVKQFGVVGGKIVHCSPDVFYKAVLRHRQSIAAQQQADSEEEGIDNGSSNS